MGRACKTYRPRPICSAQGTKNPLPLGMGSVNNGVIYVVETVLTKTLEKTTT
ncbi:MAG: hypothetical protein SPG66_07890 [Anaerovibrio sp.]|nr:hypothetical protein [Veillonellaceae bacterium]MDY5330741.1 hypothetical protein [Anaerovibrio sp.]